MTGSSYFPNGFQGRHMLICLSIFFGTMFVVNGIFLYYAISTFNGLSTEDAYRTGLHYNTRIAEENSQKELGWISSLSTSESRSHLTVTISDRNQIPVSNLKIDANLQRPASNRFDIPLTFKESNPGEYVTKLIDAGRGNWVLDFSATKPPASGKTTNYRIKKRLWLTPPK